MMEIEEQKIFEARQGQVTHYKEQKYLVYKSRFRVNVLCPCCTGPDCDGIHTCGCILRQMEGQTASHLGNTYTLDLDKVCINQQSPKVSTLSYDALFVTLIEQSVDQTLIHLSAILKQLKHDNPILTLKRLPVLFYTPAPLSASFTTQFESIYADVGTHFKFRTITQQEVASTDPKIQVETILAKLLGLLVHKENLLAQEEAFPLSTKSDMARLIMRKVGEKSTKKGNQKKKPDSVEVGCGCCSSARLCSIF
ncbi:hypothetical protein FGO68_gene2309 [Halteria grandinella]|uniref:Uncharacterized protein n=1 Tax=Halteria grandinella TaxID=5974 RepID=A0A8J8NN16_HALGN|nr:hypothetical protein FGO68_gene2309 [Halteria grandinella]